MLTYPALNSSMYFTGLRKAIIRKSLDLEGCGYNRKFIANALGVELITVYKWFSAGQISKKCAFKAEVATGGKIKAYELRPDVSEFKVS